MSQSRSFLIFDDVGNFNEYSWLSVCCGIFILLIALVGRCNMLVVWVLG